MKLIPLASSSSGNAYLLEDGRSRLLIECGLSWRRLQRLLGFGTNGLCGCLVSHEHHDHAGCYGALVKNGVPVYMSGGTAQALDFDLCEALEPWKVERVGSFEVLPFPVFHDAEEPLGFLIRSAGEKLVFATDTVNLAYQFPGVSLAAVEANYDEAILSRSERMPDKVKDRVRNTHMDILRCCKWLEKLDKSRLREVYLMHLSAGSSDEWRFRQLAQDVLGPAVHVVVCPKEKV